MMDRVLRSDMRRIRRGKADMTQEELALKAGCTRQTIAAIERGKYNPSLVLALRLAEVLEVEIGALFWLENFDKVDHLDQ